MFISRRAKQAEHIAQSREVHRRLFFSITPTICVRSRLSDTKWGTLFTENFHKFNLLDIASTLFQQPKQPVRFLSRSPQMNLKKALQKKKRLLPCTIAFQ